MEYQQKLFPKYLKISSKIKRHQKKTEDWKKPSLEKIRESKNETDKVFSLHIEAPVGLLTQAGLFI